MARLLLLRHGEMALNRGGALRGRLEVPLSPEGAREARRLAARIVTEYPLAALYSSPLLRARATADAIARVTQLDVVVDARFVDLDYGTWAGRSADTFTKSERAEYRRWCRSPDVPLDGSEDPIDVQRRALAGLETHARSDTGCVAIVTHDAVLQLVLCHALNLDLRNYRSIAQHTATLNDLQWLGICWRIHLLNSTWHLDDDPDA